MLDFFLHKVLIPTYNLLVNRRMAKFLIFYLFIANDRDIFTQNKSRCLTRQLYGYGQKFSCMKHAAKDWAMKIMR